VKYQKSDLVLIVAHSTVRAHDLLEPLEELNLRHEFRTASQVHEVDPANYAALWLMAGPNPHPEVLSPELSELAQGFLTAGLGVFAEFVRGFVPLGAEGKLRRAGAARVVVGEGFGGAGALPRDRILVAHDALTLEIPKRHLVFACFEDVVGTNRVLSRHGTPWPALVGGVAVGKWVWSAFRLSDFVHRQFSPQVWWRALVRDVLHWLLSPEARERTEAHCIPVAVWTEPRTWAPGTLEVVVNTLPGAQVTAIGLEFQEQTLGHFVATAHAAGTWSVKVTRDNRSRNHRVTSEGGDRMRAYRRSLDRSLGWFEHSGVLLAADGSLGVAQWISGPDGEGKRIPFGKEQMFDPGRADSLFQSGLAFLQYGTLASDPRHRSIGRNILLRVLEFQRLSPDDEFGGLWFTRGRSGPPYEQDEAMAILFSLAAWNDTGESLFLERGMLAARKSLDLFGLGTSASSKATNDTEHPSVRGQMYAAWLAVFLATGETQYRDQALAGLLNMRERWKVVQKTTISQTSEAVRWLLPLTLASRCSDNPVFREELATTAAYLRSRRAPCGAIREECHNPEGSHDNTEPLSDQLYTTGWGALNLLTAYRFTGEKVYLEDFEILMDYLVRIQCRTEDRSLYGGWTRCFDFNLWESHGSNADLGSAWCLETGWCNAIIALALAGYLKERTEKA